MEGKTAPVCTLHMLKTILVSCQAIPHVKLLYVMYVTLYGCGHGCLEMCSLPVILSCAPQPWIHSVHLDWQSQTFTTIYTIKVRDCS